MRGAPLACLVVVALAGCGGDDGRGGGTTTFGSGFVRSPQLPAEELERAYTTGMPSHPEGPAGAPSVLVQAGCLACHQIATSGNSGPGNTLSAIGTRRTASQIRRSLLGGAPAPMPSFRALPRAKLDALVAYLAALGDRDCPGTSDCG
jgi:mono/diheme cytochrome c family protein